MQRAKTDAVGRVRRERSMFRMSLAPVLRVRMLRSIRGRRRAGARSRDAAEQRAGYQPGAAWIVEVEQAADHFTGAVESRNRCQHHVEHLAARGVDAQAAESER